MMDVLPASKAIYTSALHDHDYVGTKKYVIVPIPNTIKFMKKAIAQKKCLDQSRKPKALKTLTSCNICGYTTTRKVLSERHKMKHKYLKYMACDRCEVQKTDAGYQCPDCSFVAKNSTGLRVHSKIHSQGTPYKCTECEFSATNLKNLIKHYKETKNLQCLYCTFSTHVKGSIVAHKRTHTYERPFSCAICGASFGARCNLYRHMRKHKDIELIELTTDDIK